MLQTSSNWSRIWMARRPSRICCFTPAKGTFAEASAENPACFCRATQQSFLRLATTTAILNACGAEGFTNQDAAELFDTGVNMGTATATGFLQRALNALNREARDYPDIAPDGAIGPRTLSALDGLLAARGKSGETVLLRAMEALQGERYIALAERRPSQEAFLYGWLANRIGSF